MLRKVDLFLGSKDGETNWDTTTNSFTSIALSMFAKGRFNILFNTQLIQYRVYLTKIRSTLSTTQLVTVAPKLIHIESVLVQLIDRTRSRHFPATQTLVSAQSYK